MKAKRAKREVKVVGFNQLTAAERLIGEIVAFGRTYYEVAEIDNERKRVKLVQVPEPKYDTQKQWGSPPHLSNPSSQGV